MEPKTNIDNLKSYREAVAFLAKNKVDNLLHNAGNEHALIIFENIFKNAVQEICIVAKDLNNEEVVLKPSYLSALSEFLSKNGVKLKVLVSEFDSDTISSEDDSFFRRVFDSKAYKEGRVEIKNGNGMGFRNNAYGDSVLHFCVADGTMFRLETDIKQRKAICNFGDQVFTSELRKAFNLGFDNERSTIIDLNQLFDN